MFKKRFLPFGLGGYNPPQVILMKSDESGVRSLVHVSPHDFRVFNPIDTLEFPLTEQLRAGVPLREVSCNILNESPEMSSEQILETLEAQDNQQPNK